MELNYELVRRAPQGKVSYLRGCDVEPCVRIVVEDHRFMAAWLLLMLLFLFEC